jgi:hypothetical protein
LLVGAAIIIFKLKVPLRLGLSMEFAVAVVLILLGLEAAGKILYTAGTSNPPDFFRRHETPDCEFACALASDFGALSYSHPSARACGQTRIGAERDAAA